MSYSNYRHFCYNWCNWRNDSLASSLSDVISDISSDWSGADWGWNIYFKMIKYDLFYFIFSVGSLSNINKMIAQLNLCVFFLPTSTLFGILYLQSCCIYPSFEQQAGKRWLTLVPGTTRLPVVKISPMIARTKTQCMYLKYSK